MAIVENVTRRGRPSGNLHYWSMTFRKKSIQETTKMLTEHHKRQQFCSGKILFNSIVTCDRTWVYHFTRETNRQSLSSGDVPTRQTNASSSWHGQRLPFWNRKDVRLVEYYFHTKWISTKIFSRVRLKSTHSRSAPVQMRKNPYVFRLGKPNVHAHIYLCINVITEKKNVQIIIIAGPTA